MEILKFESKAPKPRRRKSTNKPILAIVGVAAVAVLGSTLAASITLNSSTSVEFGQGVAQTSSCDPTTGITVNPTATYQNAANAAGSFKFGTIALTGISSDCAGKMFTIKVYDNASSDPLTINSASGTTAWKFATFYFASPTATNKSSNINTDVTSYAAGSGDNGTYTVSFPTTGQIDPADVFKITLESSAS